MIAFVEIIDSDGRLRAINVGHIVEVRKCDPEERGANIFTTFGPIHTNDSMRSVLDDIARARTLNSAPTPADNQS